MTDIATASVVLSSFVLVVAALLGWREWSDRLARPADPSPEDARHFHHQDSRRTIGLVILSLLAVSLVVGSRLPPKIEGRASTPFLIVWLAVFLLIALLLALALIDWLALRIFARRHRSRILRERIETLRDEARRRKAPGVGGNGHHEGPEAGPLR